MASKCDWAFVMLSDGAMNPETEAGRSYTKDVKDWVEESGLERTILWFEGPSAGGVPFQQLFDQTPDELKQKPPVGVDLLSKLAKAWNTSDQYLDVCLNKVVATAIQDRSVSGQREQPAEQSGRVSREQKHAPKQQLGGPVSPSAVSAQFKPTGRANLFDDDGSAAPPTMGTARPSRDARRAASPPRKTEARSPVLSIDEFI